MNNLVTRSSWTLVLVLLMSVGCNDEPAALLQGQANAQLTFYGLAVDQDGRPLQGVSFEVVVDAIPRDWSFETRGRPYDRTRHTVMTDANGRFDIDVMAHMLFVEPLALRGYRHFFPQWSNDGNTGYRITSWGEQMYKSDPEHPAIYVFVKDRVREVSALPCRGGFEGRAGHRVMNRPMWPRTPSLNDVVQKPADEQQSTTRPATSPTEHDPRRSPFTRPFRN